MNNSYRQYMIPISVFCMLTSLCKVLVTSNRASVAAFFISSVLFALLAALEKNKLEDRDLIEARMQELNRDLSEVKSRIAVMQSLGL